MGNSGAKPELDTYIRYRYKGYNEEIELLFANLKNKARYSKKIPSDSQLKKEFEAFASKMTTTPEAKKVIENLPKKYKWRLLCKHADIISGKCKTGSNTKSALEKLLERLIQEPTVYNFRVLFEEIKVERAEHEEIFWKDFKNYRGPQILLEILNSQSIFAREQKNYELLLKLLEFIHFMITQFDHGVDYLKRAQGGIQTIVGCINPVHPVVTGYVYDITSQFIVGSDEDFDSICRGFGEYKNAHNLPTRFQVLINILKDSPNVILIRNTLQFLLTMITLSSNKSRAALIRQELLELNIENVFEIILGRIKMGKYSIKDCTEQAYLDRLKKSNQTNHFSDDIAADPSLSNLKSILTNSTRLGNSIKEDDQENEEEDDETETQHEHDHDQHHQHGEFSSDDENEDIEDDFQQLSVTLCEKDGKVFEKHLKGIQELMHLFLTVNLERQDISEGSGNAAGMEISFDSLTEKLRKKAFDYDCYDQLVGSLQKLLLLPNDQDKVKKVFTSLDKALSKIFTSKEGAISEKDLSGILEQQETVDRLVKQLKDAEAISKNQEANIKSILADKDEMVVKFNYAKNASSQMEAQIQNLLEEINKLKSSNIDMQSKQTQMAAAAAATATTTIPQAPQLSGVPQAPNLGIPQAPNLGIPQAPNLGIPQAPNLGIPQAPNLGIPQAPNLGIPQAPNLGIPQAPNLGIPQAPNLGIPQAPNLGIPQAPNLGISQQTTEKSSIPQAPNLGIPQAPNLGIPQAPNLGIPQAPNLGIPQAPNLGIPQAPNLGIPQAPNLGISQQTTNKSSIPQAPNLGIPQAPNLGIPQAPNLGIPQAPNLGIPQAPNLGIPQAPNLGIPQAPNLGIPQAPNLGIPQAPNLGIPQAPNLGIPQAPNLGIPSAPNLGIPQAPSLGIPQAPSLGGIPQAPSLGIPQAPSLGGIPTAPSFGAPTAPALFGAPSAPSLLGGPPSAPNIGLPQAPMIPGFAAAPNLNLPMMGAPPMIGGFMMPPMGPPAKAKRKPNIPLKNFMWNTVPANSIKNTIWEKLNDEKVAIDISFLEAQFEKPAVVVKGAAAAGGADASAAAKQAVMTKVSLIAADRTKTMEIVIMKLKMSAQLLANALITIDEKILTLNNLQSLSNISPKQEEVDAVTSYMSGGGNADDLAGPEKFILEIKSVNGFADRIKALLFSHTYEEMFLDLEPKVQKMRRAALFIQQSKVIPEMLEYVLAVGNYLNGESIRGGAYGFKFDSLIKISEMKLKDNKTTLMMYVIEQMEAKNPGREFISADDESALQLMETLPISQLNSDLNEIKKNSRFVAKAITAQTSAPQDGIKSKLESLNGKLDSRIATIEQEIKFIDETYKATAVLFCEKPTDPSEKFAEKFGQLFRKIKKEKAEKIKIEEAIKKEELKKAKEEAAKNAAANKKPIQPPATGLKLPPITVKPPLHPATSTQPSQQPSSGEGEAVRGTFLGVQNVKTGESRLSKCYQNVRESLLLAKNKNGLLGVLNEMKQKKKLEGSGDGKKDEDLDSAISKLGFLNSK